MTLKRNQINDYLHQSFVMQLATVGGEGMPWVCTVYFVVDEDLNLYWLSWPTRRHSVELASNPKAAVTMPIKTDQPVIGLGAEGKVDIVRDINIIEQVMSKYVEKYSTGTEFVKNFKAATNKHAMYRFKADKYVLFDELNHPDAGSIEYIV